MSSRNPLCRAVIETLLSQAQSGNGLRAARLIDLSEVHPGSTTERTRGEARSASNPGALEAAPAGRGGAGDLTAKPLAGRSLPARRLRHPCPRGTVRKEATGEIGRIDSVDPRAGPPGALAEARRRLDGAAERDLAPLSWPPWAG
jgi:hypothetical protein